jgi:hypothetical protein
LRLVPCQATEGALYKWTNVEAGFRSHYLVMRPLPKNRLI